MPKKLPERWQSSEVAIKAAQVAFDVEEEVMGAVKQAALENSLSSSDQIRALLGLPIATRPKRPRLTVSLSEEDYETLSKKYGVKASERLLIKERVTAELIEFARLQNKI